MRVFPVYAPKLIVKHVRVFFSGVIWIKDFGKLEFNEGRFLLPKRCQSDLKKIALELNDLLAEQTAQAQLA